MKLLPFTPKERYKRPFLLLEIGILNLRLYSIDSARNPVHVNLLEEVRLLPGDVSALMEAAGKILSVDRSIRDLAIVMNSPMIRHHIIGLPSMRHSRRERVLEMEARNAYTSNETPDTASFWSFGKALGIEAAKEYVLCSMMSPIVTEGIQEIVRKKDLNWIGFSSHAQFVVHLFNESSRKSDDNVALVEVNNDEGSVTLFHANVWNMERHFLLGGTGTAAEGEKPVEANFEKLKLELGRALQYFKQQVRNENISRVFLFGATRQLSEISAFLESSFKIPVTQLALDNKRFFNKSRKEQSRGDLLFTIPHIVALHADFKKYIDFVPSELRRKTQIRAQGILIAVSAIALYALLATFAHLIRQEAETIEQYGYTDVPLGIFVSRINKDMKQLRTDRQFALASERSAYWQQNRNRILSELAFELAGSASDEMQITALDIEGKENGWQVKMDAEIRSSNGSRSQQILLNFQDRMHRLSKLKQLEWKSVYLDDTFSRSRQSTDDYKAGSRLTFTLEGMLQYPPLQKESEYD